MPPTFLQVLHSHLTLLNMFCCRAPKRKAKALPEAAAASTAGEVAAQVAEAFPEGDVPPKRKASAPRKKAADAAVSKAAEDAVEPAAGAEQPPVDGGEAEDTGGAKPKAARKRKAPPAPTGPLWDPSMRPPPLSAGTPAVRILSWNVAGLRALLKKVEEGKEGVPSFEALVEAEQADVLCLQVSWAVQGVQTACMCIAVSYL
jgi:hypothetical protein